MTFFMGIDGGGSNLRVVIVDDALQPVSESQHASANPGIVGKPEAAYRIQYTMRDAMARAQLAPDDLRAVGIGVAGAAHHHAADWLRGVVLSVTPHAHVAASSDYEIALVGAHGERRGVLILAGTGSVAFGVNAAGHSVQVGGWGYLLGDEGSGYWLGSQVLQRIVQAADGRAAPVSFSKRVLRELALAHPVELIPWLYTAAVPRTREIAALAPLVLEAASQNDPFAQALIEQASAALLTLVKTVTTRLKVETTPIAFAGGLLNHSNPLSLRLAALLDLAMLPEAKHAPATGAALLARLTRPSA